MDSSLFSTATSTSTASVSSESEDGQDREAYEDALFLYKRMRADDDPHISTQLHTALDVVEQALRLYGPSHVFASYNGGKDAVVVMHLLRVALAHYVQAHELDEPSSSSSTTSTVPRPRLVYFEQPSTEFPEVKALVTQTTQRYDLDLKVYQNVPFAQGLKACIESEGGAPLAFLLGTRKGDPNCKEQETFAPSSTWMPAFMRVNPILNWTYGDIWHFLRKFNLPYCSLYDQGYTSLGKVDDTLPNPALAVGKTEGGGYYPAHMLTDWSLERAGRVDKKKEATARVVAADGGGIGEGEECDAIEAAAAAVAAAAGAAGAPTPPPKGSHNDKADVKTAGLIIIGDEILKGKTSDTNSLYAARRLRERGVSVQRISVLSDAHADIEAEVRVQAAKFDIVITSGGVGPTHDDITIKAVASALGQGVSENEEMIGKLQEAYGVATREELSDGQRKMALLPDHARLRVPPPPPPPPPHPLPPAGASTAAVAVGTIGTKKVWPVLMCGNVYVLPGVPSFFEQKMDTIVDHFLNHSPIYTRKVVLEVDEVEIVEPLNRAVAEFEKQGCVFGSYPFYGEACPRVVITLESTDEAMVEAAKDFFLGCIPPGHVLHVGEDDDLRGREGEGNMMTPAAVESANLT